MVVKKLLLSFPQGSAGEPVAMELIKTYHLDFNILKAFIDDNVKGTLLLEVRGENENIEKGMTFLREHQVGVREIQSVIEVEHQQCVDCGACTAVCSVDALEMDENWNLVHHEDKCLECMQCVQACPMRAIRALI
ncbi:NIL domain-containing protein [Eubacteriaceae bacterium ES3]|nr:NIL domain-containing protein [Eubacteriaceae bacterium ES3]